MTSFTVALMRAACVAALAALASTAHPASSASSAVSDSASSTASSASDSLRGSSQSSSPGGRTAAGELRIVEVAMVAERPGRVQLRLQPLADAAQPAFTLEMPQATLAAAALGAGDVIAARQQPWGVEFATTARPGRAAAAFFLVLDDDWHRELATRRVTL